MDQVISSAAGQHLAPVGQAMGQGMDRGAGDALHLDAQLQVGQGIYAASGTPPGSSGPCGAVWLMS